MLRQDARMIFRAARELDRAVERRWPRLFRFDVRQALWASIGLQIAVLLGIFFSDATTVPGAPVLAGSISLLGRVLWETRHEKPALR